MAASSEPSESSTAEDADDSHASSVGAAPSGAMAANAPEELTRTLWYYRDRDGKQQGPYSLPDMQQWYAKL